MRAITKSIETTARRVLSEKHAKKRFHQSNRAGLQTEETLTSSAQDWTLTATTTTTVAITRPTKHDFDSFSGDVSKGLWLGARATFTHRD